MKALKNALKMLTRVMPRGTTFMHPLKKIFEFGTIQICNNLYSKEPKLQSKLILKKIYMTKF